MSFSISFTLTVEIPFPMKGDVHLKIIFPLVNLAAIKLLSAVLSFASPQK